MQIDRVFWSIFVVDNTCVFGIGNKVLLPEPEDYDESLHPFSN